MATRAGPREGSTSMSGTDYLITLEDVRDLANLLDGIAAIWKLIGIQLRLTLGTLDNIANSCTKVEECLVRMLSKWINVYGHEATVSRLIAALKSKSVKELRIAEEVQEHFHTKRGANSSEQSEGGATGRNEPQTQPLAAMPEVRTLTIEEKKDLSIAFAVMLSRLSPLMNKAVDFEAFKCFLYCFRDVTTGYPYIEHSIYSNCGSTAEVLMALLDQHRFHAIQPDLLNTIVEEFGCGESKRLIREYKSKIPKKHPLKRCNQLTDEEIESSIGTKKLKVETSGDPDTYSLEDAGKVQNVIGKSFEVSCDAIVLANLEPGSVILTFIVPECTLRSFADESKAKKHLSDLATVGILSIETDQFTIDVEALLVSQELEQLSLKDQRFAHLIKPTSSTVKPTPSSEGTHSDGVDDPNIYYDERGRLKCRSTDCMIVASFGDQLPTGVKVSTKLKPGGELPYGARYELDKVRAIIEADKTKSLRYVYEDYEGEQRSKWEYMYNIRHFLSQSQAQAGVIWYTGHGVKDTGDWVFKDGVITFQEIFELYKNHFHGKLLSVVSDCGYSGRWIEECAKALDHMGIAACGHKAKEAGYMIKVFTSCSRDESAYETYYSCHGGVVLKEDSITYYGNTKLCPVSESMSQTTAWGDFTQITCYHEPHQSCYFPQLPAALQWTWQDLTRKSSRENICERLWLVRGKDGGRPVWQYVSVYNHLEDAFRKQVATGTVDVAEYGHILASGWGKDPPKDVQDRLNKQPGCAVYGRY